MRFKSVGRAIRRGHLTIQEPKDNLPGSILKRGKLDYPYFGSYTGGIRIDILLYRNTLSFVNKEVAQPKRRGA
jgi:hypothetical protein